MSSGATTSRHPLASVAAGTREACTGAEPARRAATAAPRVQGPTRGRPTGCGGPRGVECLTDLSPQTEVAGAGSLTVTGGWGDTVDSIAEIVTRLRTAPSADERELLFGEVVRRFADMAFACAYAVLGDVHLAEDAAQEAFAVAWRQLGRVREPAAFPGWFRRVVLSQAHRLLRGRRAGELSLDTVGDLASEGPAPAAERQDVQARVRRAILALPARERLATVLYYIGDYPVADIAAMLGVPVSTVKNRLHAARGRLREGELAMAQDEVGTRRPSRDAGFAERVRTRLFPYRTDLRFYEDRADGLVSVWRSGLPSALALIRQWHPRFVDATDEEVQAAAFGPQEARLVLARQHGFATWMDFAAHIAALARGDGGGDPFLVAFHAIEAGDVAGLRACLDAHPDLVHARGTNGNSLLNLAGGCGAVECALLLLERGADPDLANDRGWTPLHQAGYSDNVPLAQALLARGADPARSAHGDGGTPLVQALFWGHRAAADLLVARGVYPGNLRVAAGVGRLDLLRTHLAPDGSLRPGAGAHRAFYRPHTGFPEWRPSDDPQEILDEAFTYAARSGRIDALAFLLEHGAAIDGDPYRGTALLWAVAKHRAETVGWLLDHGAHVSRRATFGGPGHGQGVTALHLAAQGGDLAMARLLVERGADTRIEDDLFHATPGGWAQHFGHADVAAFLSTAG